MVLEENGNPWSNFHALLDSMQKRATLLGADALWIMDYQTRLIAQSSGLSSVQVLQAVALKYADNLEYLGQYPKSLRLQRPGKAADTLATNWDYRITTAATATPDTRWLMTEILPWIPPLALPAAQQGYVYKWSAGKSRLRIKDADGDTRYFDYEFEGNSLTKVEGTEITPEKRSKQQLDMKVKGERLVETRLQQNNKTLWHHYYNYDSQNRLSSIEHWMIEGNNRSKVFELYIDYRSKTDIPASAIINP